MLAGRKPTATVIKLKAGNPGHQRIPVGEPIPQGAVERPSGLRGKPGQLWDKFIARAFWLTWADSTKAAMWCHLQAEFEKSPVNMVASRIGQLRALGSELGFDPSSRARLGTGSSAPKSKFDGLIGGSQKA